jgi:hypothetical protein
VRFIQSMAFAHLNQTQEARKSFDAGKALTGAAADYTTGNFEGYWVVWSIAELLGREADGVLKSRAAEAPVARP